MTTISLQTMCLYTVALMLHSTDNTPHKSATYRHTGHENTLYYVTCTFCENNLWRLQLRGFTVHTLCSRNEMFTDGKGEGFFLLSPGGGGPCVKVNICVC